MPRKIIQRHAARALRTVQILKKNSSDCFWHMESLSSLSPQSRVQDLPSSFCLSSRTRRITNPSSSGSRLKAHRELLLTFPPGFAACMRLQFIRCLHQPRGGQNGLDISLTILIISRVSDCPIAYDLFVHLSSVHNPDISSHFSWQWSPQTCLTTLINFNHKLVTL